MLPTNTTETAVQPTFRVITKYRIDTSSIHWKRLLIDDSTKVQVPTICVLPYSSYQSFDTLSFADTIWALIADTGTGTIINDTTIEFKASTLLNSQLFEVVLMGLREISGSDTINVSDTVARLRFTTIALPPKLITINAFAGSALRMHDTVTARFTSKLDSANTSSGPILSLFVRHATFDTTSDSLSVNDSTIGSLSWVDANDSSVVHTLPTTPFGLGDNYFIKYDLSGLTGDSTQQGTWDFNCRKSFRLNITTQATAGLTSLPTIHFDPRINEEYMIAVDSLNDTTAILDTNFVGRIVNANDTVTYAAPARSACAEFWKWSCPGYPAWDNSTANPIAISLDPDHLSDLNLVALYKPIPLDTLIVSATCPIGFYCGNIEIRSDSVACGDAISDTCADTCKYYIQHQRVVSLRAYSSSNRFQSWSSSDPNIDGSTSPYVQLVMNGTESFVANFAPPPSPQPPFADLCASIQKDNGHSGWSCNSSIANIVIPSCNLLSGGCISVPYGSSNPVTIKILDRTYGIKSYSDAGGFHDWGGVVHDLYSGGGNGTFTLTEVAPANVTFVVAKLRKVTLTIIVARTDKLLPKGTLVTGAEQGNFQSMWCQVSQQDGNGEALPYPGAASSPTVPDKMSFTLEYDLGTIVNLSPGANNGFTFSGWTGGGTSPLTLTMSDNITVGENIQAAFMVVSIRFTRDVAVNEQRWYDVVDLPVDQWGDNQADVSAHPTNSPMHWDTTAPLSFVVEFNQPIGTIGSVDGHYGLAYERSKDWRQRQLCSPAEPSWHLNPQDPSGSSIIVDFDYAGYPDVWKGEDCALDIAMHNIITNTNGEHLSNRVRLPFSTVGPDLKWEIQWFWPMGLCDESLFEVVLGLPGSLRNVYQTGLWAYESSSKNIAQLSPFGWPTDKNPQDSSQYGLVCDKSAEIDKNCLTVNRVAGDGMLTMRTECFTHGGGCEGGNISSAISFVLWAAATVGMDGGISYLVKTIGFDVLPAVVSNLGLIWSTYLETVSNWGCDRYVGFSYWPPVGQANFWGYWLNDDGHHIPDPDWATPYGYGDYGALKSHVNVTIQ
ncbi:MAG: hypothetical protein Q8922_10635 [Bacteroidota bacterium]|nr:hypothetical protein [Bacteroidota bacterium]MDP4233022.1 hypothetical protein [Bacteroidota bacterium]MDP4241833.1 hypothetical protein [Bacteroidota bacterium]MDP4288382.1 hypothetical protein [Bacteroidota bacterium]